MRLDLVLWQVVKTFYSLSLFVMLPFFAFVWIAGLNDKAFPPTSAQIQTWLFLTISYFALGWFVLIYTPKKYRSDLYREIELYKKQGFVPTVEVIGYKNFNSYAAWNESTDQFVMINLNDNVSIMTSKRSGLLKWHLKEREKIFEMITDVHTPNQHIVRSVIPVRPEQYHTLLSILTKHKKSLEEQHNTRPPFLPSNP